MTSLVVLPEDQASRELMRHIDSVYDERYRAHSQSCCVSLAPGYVCKLCRSYEAGRNDVLIMRPNDTIEVFFRFRDFLGKYVMHCHNVVHEDHAMMIRFDIVP